MIEKQRLELAQDATIKIATTADLPAEVAENLSKSAPGNVVGGVMGSVGGMDSVMGGMDSMAQATIIPQSSIPQGSIPAASNISLSADFGAGFPGASPEINDAHNLSRSLQNMNTNTNHLQPAPTNHIHQPMQNNFVHPTTSQTAGQTVGQTASQAMSSYNLNSAVYGGLSKTALELKIAGWQKQSNDTLLHIERVQGTLRNTVAGDRSSSRRDKDRGRDGRDGRSRSNRSKGIRGGSEDFFLEDRQREERRRAETGAMREIEDAAMGKERSNNNRYRSSSGDHRGDRRSVSRGGSRGRSAGRTRDGAGSSDNINQLPGGGTQSGGLSGDGGISGGLSGVEASNNLANNNPLANNLAIEGAHERAGSSRRRSAGHADVNQLTALVDGDSPMSGRPTPGNANGGATNTLEHARSIYAKHSAESSSSGGGLGGATGPKAGHAGAPFIKNADSDTPPVGNPNGQNATSNSLVMSSSSQGMHSLHSLAPLSGLDDDGGGSGVSGPSSRSGGGNGGAGGVGNGKAELTNHPVGGGGTLDDVAINVGNNADNGGVGLV